MGSQYKNKNHHFSQVMIRISTKILVILAIINQFVHNEVNAPTTILTGDSKKLANVDNNQKSLNSILAQKKLNLPVEQAQSKRIYSELESMSSELKEEAEKKSVTESDIKKKVNALPKKVKMTKILLDSFSLLYSNFGKKISALHKKSHGNHKYHKKIEKLQEGYDNIREKFHKSMDAGFKSVEAARKPLDSYRHPLYSSKSGPSKDQKKFIDKMDKSIE